MFLSNQKIQDCGNPLYFPTQLWGQLEFLQGDICQKIAMSGDKKSGERDYPVIMGNGKGTQWQAEVK